ATALAAIAAITVAVVQGRVARRDIAQDREGRGPPGARGRLDPAANQRSGQCNPSLGGRVCDSAGGVWSYVALTVLSTLVLLVAEARAATLGVWIAKPLASTGFVLTAIAGGALDSSLGRSIVL